MQSNHFEVKTHHFTIHGMDFLIQDLKTSGTLDYVVNDLKNDAYGISNLTDVQPGDTLVDLGAHVGLVAIYLAKRFPYAKIVAVEPFPLNAANLKHNLELNNVTNVELIEKAITSNSRLIDLGCTPVNTGGAIDLYGSGTPYIESMTLDDLVTKTGPLKFIKMDVEGFEFEICPTFQQWDKIHHAGIEIHNKMAHLGGTFDEIQSLIALLEKMPITGKLWTPPLSAFTQEAYEKSLENPL